MSDSSFSNLWTVAHQAPLSMGFSGPELPCPLPGDLPNPGIKSASLMSAAFAGRFFTTSTTWENFMEHKQVITDIKTTFPQPSIFGQVPITPLPDLQIFLGKVITPFIQYNKKNYL